MLVVRFGGEGKRGGEWGVKRGECGAIFGRGSPIRAEAARVGGGSGGARLGFRRKKKVGPADRAGPTISEGEAVGAGWAEREGREMGCGWARKEGREVGRGWAKIVAQAKIQGSKRKSIFN
jgi:hypothetical protein